MSRLTFTEDSFDTSPMVTKKQAEPESFQLSVRVTPALVSRADALIGHVEEMTGRPSVRADVLREALMQGLRALEREQKNAAK